MQTSTARPLFGAIEGGGTKFVCAIACSPSEIVDRVTVSTAAAPATLAECVRFFQGAEQKHGAISAFGIGCFGPIDVRVGSPRFGHMMATPKQGWSGVDILAPFTRVFTAPIALDTDVAAAAVAEWRLGAGQDAGSLVYVTVGTGIGGAAVPADAAAGRLMHAEMGHLPVRRDPRDLDFAGSCPFHGDCVEGLASGPAIRARWGGTLESLPAEHAAWSIIGGYLGQLAAAITLMLSVERIVFGGGVMANGALLPHIKAATHRYLNNYVEPLRNTERFDKYLCTPALGNDAGVLGALLLAMNTIR
jgi:fructokinase